jgi:hypothetical protein
MDQGVGSEGPTVSIELSPCSGTLEHAISSGRHVAYPGCIFHPTALLHMNLGREVSHRRLNDDRMLFELTMACGVRSHGSLPTSRRRTTTLGCQSLQSR